ncbi:MAG: zinc-ribbon domain-containing protein [Lachnotalea sp.]
MKFCEKCGYELTEDDKFCPKCGQKVYEEAKITHTKDKRSIVMGVAYLGTLFWVPILVGSEDKRARTCANQGLWMLILSFIACGSMSIISDIGIAFNRNTFIESGFRNLLFVFWNGIYTILYSSILAFMIFLLINCIMGFKSVKYGGQPHILPLVGKIQIIHD